MAHAIRRLLQRHPGRLAVLGRRARRLLGRPHRSRGDRVILRHGQVCCARPLARSGPLARQSGRVPHACHLGSAVLGAAPLTAPAQQESAALAACLAAPMHAITAEPIWGLACCASPFRLALAPVIFEASSIRFALRRHVLDGIARGPPLDRRGDNPLADPGVGRAWGSQTSDCLAPTCELLAAAHARRTEAAGALDPRLVA